MRLLALASLSVLSASRAATIVEDFSTNPLTNGWQIFGETNLFVWNPTNRDLQVTWDSSRSNSYFYYPLGAQFTRSDDLSVEFDLNLADITSGAEAGKTGPMEIGIGFLNSADAMGTSFMRGVWGGAPNVAEFDYYPAGYYEFGGSELPIAATTTPAFIAGTDSQHYAPEYLGSYEYGLPTSQSFHVRLNYDGLSQAATLVVTTNGLPLEVLPALVLNSATNSQFTGADNFSVDMVSISSYSSSGDDYDSVLAHGTVGNLIVKASIRAIGRLSGDFTTNGVWEARFLGRTNWLYTLERTTDFGSWTPVSATLGGVEDEMILQDTNALAAKAFYRVRAQ